MIFISKEINLKPFVKWAGGKTQLLDCIEVLLPRKYNNYIEPFLGGGALLLSLMPEKAIVNDINDNIINSFNVIKTAKDMLMKELKKYVKSYSEDFYYKLRDKDENLISDVIKAARFIYLNKTGYNGLYRVNSSGKINVPFGKKEKITDATIFQKSNIEKISKYLNKNDILFENKDFAELENIINEGDFVFVDPPYDSDNNKSFDSYTPYSFGKDGQKRLSEFLKRLDSKGVNWMLTNHNTDLINNLYFGYEKFLIPVNRFINSDASNRVNSTFEVIIINYNISDEQRNKIKNQLFYRQLKSSSYVLKNYVSWDNIMERLNKYELDMNDLNFLFSKNKNEFDDKFNELFQERCSCFKLTPLLLAKRLKDREKFTYLVQNDFAETFDYSNKDIVYNFIIQSGLLDNLFLSSSNIVSIKTYLTGLEIGLTSNDKKNKSGKYMVDKISSILDDKNIAYKKEVSYNEVLNIELDDDKKFDFVFEFDDKKYCLECNFFNSSGSKINSETKRFIELNTNFKRYSKLEFIWVTDGEGLKSNKNVLNQALNEIKYIFNLTTFNEFIEKL